VTDLRWPIVVLDRQQGEQQTVATLTASVGLPHHFKGTHMSRFVEVLNEHRGEITMRTLPTILRRLKERLDAETARIEVRFPYFLQRAAPVSGCQAFMDYECSFVGESNGGRDDFVLGVRVPVTSVCPCSKAISDYGAHN
jgi:GTP cyclohydrolase I